MLSNQVYLLTDECHVGVSFLSRPVRSPKSEGGRWAGRWDPIPRIRYFPISGKEEERREGMGGKEEGRGRHVARPIPPFPVSPLLAAGELGLLGNLHASETCILG